MSDVKILDVPTARLPEKLLFGLIDRMLRHEIKLKMFITAGNAHFDHRNNIYGYKAVFERNSYVSSALFNQPIQIGVVTAAYEIRNSPFTRDGRSKKTRAQMFERVKNAVQQNAHGPNQERPPYTIAHGDKQPWTPTMGGGMNFVRIVSRYDPDADVHQDLILVRASLDDASAEWISRATRNVMTFGEMIEDSCYERLKAAAIRNAGRIAYRVAQALEADTVNQTDDMRHEDSEDTHICSPLVSTMSNLFYFTKQQDKTSNVEWYCDVISPPDTTNGIFVPANPFRNIWYSGAPGAISGIEGGSRWDSEATHNMFPASFGYSLDTDFNIVDIDHLHEKEQDMIKDRIHWTGEIRFNPRAVRSIYRRNSPQWRESLMRTGWKIIWGETEWVTDVAIFAADDEMTLSINQMVRFLHDDPDETLRVPTGNIYLLPTLFKHLPTVAREFPDFKIKSIFSEDGNDVIRVNKPILQLLKELEVYTIERERAQ